MLIIETINIPSCYIVLDVLCYPVSIVGTSDNVLVITILPAELDAMFIGMACHVSLDTSN